MFLLFDIGATNMRLAASHSGLKLDRIVMAKTPAKYRDGLKTFKAMAEEILAGRPLKLAAGGIASPLGEDSSKLYKFAKPDWTGKHLHKDLSRLLGSKVRLENDSDLAGLGEAAYGAGSKLGITAYLTFSSGVGGTRIVDGKIDRSALGFEPRLMQPVPGGLLSLEKLASGRAIERRYKVKGENLNDPAAWKEIEALVAQGVINAAVFWSPDILVLGGPVAGNRHVSLSRIRQSVKKSLGILPKQPKIVNAKLEQQSGLYGALKLVKE